MWNEPDNDQLNRIIPVKLFQSEHIELYEKIIYAHFFIAAGCDFYIVEYDGEDLFWGFTDLNDLPNACWGYISFGELKDLRVGGWLEVDFDLYWEPKPAIEIEKIRRAHRWPPPTKELSSRLDSAPA